MNARVREAGSASSIPHLRVPQTPMDTNRTDGVLGGEAEPNKRKRAQPYFCNDCGRRFYNLGWHAEACGSGNFSLERENDAEPGFSEIQDPTLRLAVVAAYEGWARKYPELLEDWPA